MEYNIWAFKKPSNNNK